MGGMFFWDYGNAFLLESRRAGADISPKDTIASEGERESTAFRYPSYVQDIMGDIFSLGFGPFRWVCTSGLAEDLKATDAIATMAFNQAVSSGRLKAPVVISRDHHDVSGTDSPFRETSNIYDGSAFTADMAVQNCIGDAFRGATWVALHNG